MSSNQTKNRRETNVEGSEVFPNRDAFLKAVAKDYLGILNITPDGIWINDLDGKIVAVNDAYCRMSGYTRAELVGKSITTVKIFKSPEQANEQIKKIKEKGTDRFESKQRRKNGSVLDVDVTAVYLDRDGGQIANINRDISKRKKIEEKIRQKEAEHRHLLKYAPTAIFEIDYKVPRIKSVNDAMCRLTGYSREELLAMNPDSLVEPESAQRFRKRIHNGLTGVKIDEAVEYKCLTKDGRKLWVNLFVKPIYKEGKLDSAFVVGYDVTESKKAQEALNLAMARLHLAHEAAKSGTWEWNLKTGENTWSEETWRLYGLKPFSAKACVELWKSTIHPDDREKTLRTVYEAAEKKAELNIEYRLSDAHGKNRWLMSRGQPIKNAQGIVDRYIGVIIDISERKKAEEALKESEQLYRTLFDNSEDGFILLEPLIDEKGKAVDFRFLKVNNAYERQTGTKAATVEGKRARKVAPELEAGWLSIINRVSKTGKPVHYENYNQRTDRWFDTQYFPFAKKKVGILFRDITERKKTQEALKRSEEQYRAYMENSPVAFFVIDVKRNYQQVNNAACELLGYSKEELLQMNTSDIMFKKDILGVREHIDRLKTTGTSSIEIALKRKDGQPVFVILHAVRLPNGKSMAFCENITQRKKAEMALLESEVKYEQLVNKLPEMVFEINNSGRVVFANSKAAELTGYSKEELESGDFLANRLVAPEDAERSRENMKLMLAGALHHNNEYVFVSKKGKRFPVLMTSEPIRKNNKILGARGIAVDITERKKMEAELQERERLAAIGTTAGMVGHDIRNPLQAIAGDVYLLKEDLAMMPNVPAKINVAESIEGIEKNVGYINKIVLDLQDYARPLSPDFTEEELVGLISSMLPTIAVPDNIKLTVNVAQHVKIRTDLTFIRRALTNLINNAIQAMPDGGKLEIHVFRRKRSVFITVSDTGGGIPENLKDKIFTPMLTTKAKGQGLGLAVVKRLIDALDGKITFKSQLGEGTIFTVQLPQHKSSKGANKKP